MNEENIPRCFKTKQYNQRSGICMRCFMFKKCGAEELMGYISDISELENNLKIKKEVLKWVEK